MGQILMDICGISKVFPGVKALDDVSFQVCAGEVHALVGENGAGKSTLMNILSGVYPPNGGTILWKGDRLEPRDTRHAQRLGIAMIHQELSLATHLSVMENIFMGRLPVNPARLIDYRALRCSCEKQLKRVGLPIDLASEQVSRLSASQQQMVEIAKALALNSKLLIMDEPSASLTQAETQILLNIIRKLKSEGVSIIYISHRIEEVFAISDKITILRDGKHIQTFVTTDTNPQQVLSLMVGREFSRTKTRVCCAKMDEEPVMEVRNLCYHNKVKNVSFKVYPSEVLVITGLVGSGRTELVETIFGIRPKTDGQIFIKGKEQVGNVSHMISCGIGLVPEGRKIQGILPGLTVRENLSLSALRRFCRATFVDGRRERKEVQFQLDALRIKTPSLEQKIQYLSGGNQQKVILGRWLMCSPQILILDEPTSGIDIGAKNEIYKLIDELAHSGVTVICISSELVEVLTLADRVIVMHEGRMTAELPNHGLTQETIMQYATNQIQ